MAKHKPVYIFVIFLTFIFYVLTLMINLLSTFPTGREIGWFKSSPTDQSNKYNLEITPAGWTFSLIWGLIYIYQAIWLVYGISTIFRLNSSKEAYLYCEPAYMPIVLYICFSLNLAANSSWIFVFDMEFLGISLGLLIAAVVTIYVAIAFSLRAVYDTESLLLEMGHKLEIALARGLVQNGMAFYATWITIATHLGLAIVLAYVAGMTQEDASSVVLGMLGIFIILYNLLDLLLMDKYSRWVITPYVVLLIALSGSLAGSGAPGGRNFIITAVLLGVSLLALIGKLVIVFTRGRSNSKVAIGD